MDQYDKIKMVFHRDYYKKKLYLVFRRMELMATARNMVYKLVRMVDNHLSTPINDGTIKVLSVPLIIALTSACKKQADSKS